MGCLDLLDGPDLPPVIREYHAAKYKWFLGDPWDISRYERDAAYWRYLAAVDGLKREVGERGGRWEIGNFTYRTDKHKGQLCVDVVFPVEEEEPEYELASVEQ